MQLVIGIDPGQSTGIARFHDGHFWLVDTKTPYETIRLLNRIKPPIKCFVVIEDSRLQSATWSAVGSAAMRAKIARNVGQIDGFCSLLEEALKDIGHSYLMVSPKGKGKKLNAAQFQGVTGIAQRMNQHERDAAMIAWPYRNGIIKGE